MTWFKVDDKLASSRKVLRIPRAQRVAAMGLWALAGSWCSSALTDGAVPAYMAEELAGTEELALQLVAVGLWHYAGDETCPAGSDLCTTHRPAGMDDGWWFHEWKQCNPTKAEVEADREAARERMRKLRGGSPEVRANKPSTADEVRDPRPVPSRPEVPAEPPLASAGASAPTAKAKRGTRIPDDWRPDDKLAQEMRAELGGVVDLYAEHRRFMDHWRAAPGAKGVKQDWRATWRNWMRTAAERGSSPIRPANGHTVAPGGFDPAAAIARAARAQQEDTPWTD